MAELPKDKTASRMEVIIPINLRGLVKGLKKICYEQPVALVNAVAEKADAASLRMMSGRAAIVTMPLGIILRNTSRTVIGSTSERKQEWWGTFSYVAGFIGGASGWYLAGKAVAASLGSTAVGATIGTWGSIALGAIAAAPVTLPAFGAAFLAGTAAAALTVAVLSAIPAVANIGVAFTRTMDAWKGIAYDAEVLQPNTSVADRMRTRRNQQTIEAFYRLPAQDIEKVYTDLSRSFQAAAAQQQAADAPATKPKGFDPKW